MKTINNNSNHRNVSAKQIRGMLTTISFKISVFPYIIYEM